MDRNGIKEFLADFKAREFENGARLARMKAAQLAKNEQRARHLEQLRLAREKRRAEKPIEIEEPMEKPRISYCEMPVFVHHLKGVSR